jgi:hypothetical protein
VIECCRTSPVACLCCQFLSQRELLVSDGPKLPVRVGFPLDALGILFPNLYPEAATADPDE